MANLIGNVTVDNMQKGIVKFYNSEKGYGFLTGGNGDIFFHISDFDQQTYGEPVKGQSVVFSVGDSTDRKTGTVRTRAREIRPSEANI